MAKKTLASNSFTKEPRKSSGSRGMFGTGRFGKARFGKRDIVFDKESLASNAHTKEALSSKIT